jgi:hypothetical protein
LRFVLKMPDALVFGRILPAMGLMMCLSTFYYAYLAYGLAKRTGRNDICALSGAGLGANGERGGRAGLGGNAGRIVVVRAIRPG